MSLMKRLVFFCFLTVISFALPFATISTTVLSSSEYTTTQCVDSVHSALELPAIFDSKIESISTRTDLRTRPIKFSLLSFSLSDLQQLFNIVNFRKLYILYCSVPLLNIEISFHPIYPRAPPLFI